MTECPKCLGSKQVFNGEDYETCSFCKGKGKVSSEKAAKFDPFENMGFIDEFENT